MLLPACPLLVMPVLTLPHLGILVMFGFLQWPAPASVFSLALYRKVAKSLCTAGWDQGEAMPKKLAVSLEQLYAVLSVGICRRDGGIHVCWVGVFGMAGAKLI